MDFVLDFDGVFETDFLGIEKKLLLVISQLERYHVAKFETRKWLKIFHILCQVSNGVKTILTNRLNVDLIY